MNCLNSQETNRGPLSEMIRGGASGKRSRARYDRLDVAFRHALADFPGDEEPAAAVEQAAEVEECTTDVDIRYIDVPVLVRPQGLLKAFPLPGRFPPRGERVCRRP